MLNCEQFLDTIRTRKSASNNSVQPGKCSRVEGDSGQARGSFLGHLCNHPWAPVWHRVHGPGGWNRTRKMIQKPIFQRPRHGTAASANLSRLQLPDALSLRQTRLLQRAASRMQSCTLPGPAFFRSARHLTCSVLSGVVLRRLLSSGNIVNWDKNYGSTEKMMVQEQHPRDLARACEKVRVRDHNPRQPIRLGGCDAAAQAREHVCP